MDLIRNPKIDWLGKKWYFIGASLFLALVAAVSLGVWGLNLGVDFTGGTLAYVKFQQTPDLGRIRSALARADLGAQDVTRFDEPSANQVQIRMAQFSESDVSEGESAVGTRSRRIYEVLRQEFDGEISPEKLDLNNISLGDLTSWLEERDPEGRREQVNLEEFIAYYQRVAGTIIEARTERGGLFKDWGELDDVDVADAVKRSLRDSFYLGSFTVLSVESVGPKVGRELQERAQNAVLFSLLGMLAYIAVRFQFIFGLAAVVAIFHDVFLTVGFLALIGEDVTLTVIAALLTLVGYSINDTIVIFDRVRENLHLMRRSDLPAIFNASVNQCLNRAVLTSGATFLAVL
ncbi:MAG TPA: protein translocase subunit SecF, partial [Acidobacteriota bacterium]|nr:protein translocase subunit SecF [Acidobacteriota bacterium]